MILGYTRAGHEVLLPTRGAPSSEAFPQWASGDHADAERIFEEHGEREQDPKIRAWCKEWRKLHRKFRRGAKKSVHVRGAAEIAVKNWGPVKR